VTSNEKLRYINEIFEKRNDGNYTQDALLYQDILRYYFSINKTLSENNPFLLRELQNWIVRNNLEIVKYYQGSKSHTSYSNKIHAKEGRINAKFENLVEWKLFHGAGTQKGKKVKVDVSLYVYSKMGILLTLIIKSMNLENIITSGKEKEKVIAMKELEKNTQNIYNLIDSVLEMKQNSPSSHIFYSALFRKCNERGVFHKMVKHVFNLAHSTSRPVQNMNQLFEYALDFGFKEKRERTYFLELWFETIEELNQEVQQLILYQMKLSAERRFEDSLVYNDREYEKLRFDSRDNYEIIVVEGVCEKCKRAATVKLPYKEYRKRFAEVEPNDHIKLDCNMCNTKDCFALPIF
jgi:hypothetical protein